MARINLFLITMAFFTLFIAEEGIAQAVAFPNLDAQLVDIWYQAENESHQFCLLESENVQALWMQTRNDLSKRTQNAPLYAEFVSNLDGMMEMLPTICNHEDPLELAEYTYHLIWEFRVLRYFLEEETYELDLLWDIYDIHHEVLMTVNDDKFGLLSWPEFMSMVEEVSALWSQYTTLQFREDMSPLTHQESLHAQNTAKVTECLGYFVASLESAYQTDFQLPCDELGDALKEAIRSHVDIRRQVESAAAETNLE